MESAKSQLMKTITWTLGAIFVSSLIGWTVLFESPVTQTQPVQRALVKKGQKIFRTQGCWSCHHTTLKGQRWASSLERPVSEGWLRAFLLAPRTVKKAAAMPSYGWLVKGADGKQNVKALAAYLNSLLSEPSRGGQTHKERQTGEASSFSLPEGRKLYSKYCKGCHGASGKGNQAFAKRLQVRLPDLTDTKQFYCRSGRKVFVKDIERTIRHGMSHRMMLPYKKYLNPKQLRSIVEYVRQLAPEGYWRAPDPFDEVLIRQMLPESRRLSRPQFRGWLRHWWFVQYLDWKKQVKANGQTPWMTQVAWERWMRWQRYGKWLEADPRRLRASRADWRGAMKKRFLKAFPKGKRALERAQNIKSFESWLKVWFYKLVTGKKTGESIGCWMPGMVKGFLPNSVKPICAEDVRSKVSRKLRQMNFLKYEPWRSQREKSSFNRWVKIQKRWMFRAWEGSRVYEAMKCASCHGQNGEGKEIALPVLQRGWHQKAKGKVFAWSKKKQVIKVRDFKEGKLRCGASPKELYHTMRSFMSGWGRHMSVTEPQLRKHYGHYPTLWARHQSAKLSKHTLNLVTYLRFLTRELPITRTVAFPKELPFPAR